MKSRIVGIVGAVAVLGISLYMKRHPIYASHIDTYYVVNLIIISATVAIALAASVAISYSSKKGGSSRCRFKFVTEPEGLLPHRLRAA